MVDYLLSINGWHSLFSSQIGYSHTLEGKHSNAIMYWFNRYICRETEKALISHLLIFKKNLIVYKDDMSQYLEVIVKTQHAYLLLYIK